MLVLLLIPILGMVGCTSLTGIVNVDIDNPPPIQDGTECIAIADAFVHQSWPNGNFGGETVLSMNPLNKRTLLKFEVSGIGTIGQAQIWLYNNATKDNNSRTLVFEVYDKTWEEGTGVGGMGQDVPGVKWSNKPSWGIDPIGRRQRLPCALPNNRLRGRIIFEITPFMSGKPDGIYSFMLYQEIATGMSWYSKEYTDPLPPSIPEALDDEGNPDPKWMAPCLVVK